MNRQEADGMKASLNRARRDVVTIVPGDLDDARICALLEEHLRTARAATAACSDHALEVSELKAPDVNFWAAWDGDVLLGVGALQRLSPQHGEIKSMHTARSQRRKGVAAAMLAHIIEAARAMGLVRLSLETGSADYFAAARALYQRHGFAECPPFGEYSADPNSIFMSRGLSGPAPPPGLRSRVRGSRHGQ
jgi:putative acetyltransferase